MIAHARSMCARCTSMRCIAKRMPREETRCFIADKNGIEVRAYQKAASPTRAFQKRDPSCTTAARGAAAHGGCTQGDQRSKNELRSSQPKRSSKRWCTSSVDIVRTYALEEPVNLAA